MSTADPLIRRDDSLEQRYQALLEISESITTQRDLEELFRQLAKSLHRVVVFDFLAVVLYEPARNITRLHILESSLPTHIQPGVETPVEESPAG